MWPRSAEASPRLTGFGPRGRALLRFIPAVMRSLGIQRIVPDRLGPDVYQNLEGFWGVGEKEGILQYLRWLCQLTTYP